MGARCRYDTELRFPSLRLYVSQKRVTHSQKSGFLAGLTTYNVRNQISAMKQGSLITTYNYSSQGFLRSETLNSSVTTYTYTNSLWLNGVRNSDGSRSTYTYRADGKRRSGIESAPGSLLTTYIWDGDDYLGEV